MLTFFVHPSNWITFTVKNQLEQTSFGPKWNTFGPFYLLFGPFPNLFGPFSITFGPLIFDQHPFHTYFGNPKEAVIVDDLSLVLC